MAWENIVLSLITMLSLVGCGRVSGSSKGAIAGQDLVAANAGGSANAILSFVPATGSYTRVPGSVQVNFASSSLDPAGAAAISGYSISCGGNPLAAQNVTYLPGLSSVSVALPSITGLAEGTLCLFTISANLKDGSGNFVVGQHTVAYTISSAGQAVTGSGSWNEAASTTYTSAVGNAVGSGFLGIGGGGMALSGLLLNGGQTVNGVAGLWSQGFASTTNSTGPVQGASAGGFSQLSCPAGYRISGIYGQVGSYINQLGIICKTEDQTQTYTSPSFGGSVGVSFSLSCPVGQFAIELGGMSDNYLQQLYLGCR